MIDVKVGRFCRKRSVAGWRQGRRYCTPDSRLIVAFVKLNAAVVANALISNALLKNKRESHSRFQACKSSRRESSGEKLISITTRVVSVAYPSDSTKMVNSHSPSNLEQQITQAQVRLRDQIQVELVRNYTDLLAAFRLLYKAYLRAGLVSENASQLRVTPFHLLPTTEVFVAKCENEVISTLSMVADTGVGLPMDSMYATELTELRKSGLQLAEIGSLADRRNLPIRFINVFELLARLIVQVAQVRGIDALVLAVHPRHAKFYMRAFGFETLGGLANCPYAEGNPAVALILEFRRIRGTIFDEKLFGTPIENERLVPTQWSLEARNDLRFLALQQFDD